jgi:hypothetical protein
MKNIYVIPTNKPSRVYGIIGSYRLGLTSNDPFYTENFGGGTQNQNIYVTSDEEVEDGEYGICLNLIREGFKSHQAVFKMNSGQRYAMEELGGQKKAEVLKVIITTDQDLIKGGVQPIEDEFLEWFVKNPSCEKVEITYETPKVENAFQQGILNGLAKNYPDVVKKPKIIIPKEDWLLNNPQCKQIESCSKSLSKKCICPKEKPKQDTLEEVAERFVENWFENGDRTVEVFKAGVKWQQERSYSEEEVEHLIHLAVFQSHCGVKDRVKIPNSNECAGFVNKWFEQFKKK